MNYDELITSLFVASKEYEFSYENNLHSVLWIIEYSEISDKLKAELDKKSRTESWCISKDPYACTTRVKYTPKDSRFFDKVLKIKNKCIFNKEYNDMLDAYRYTIKAVNKSENMEAERVFSEMKAEMEAEMTEIVEFVINDHRYSINKNSANYSEVKELTLLIADAIKKLDEESNQISEALTASVHDFSNVLTPIADLRQKYVDMLEMIGTFKIEEST